MTQPVYGLDLYCGDDLDPLMRETEGDETMQLLVWRVLQTPQGSLLDDPDFGIDMVGLLSAAMVAGGPDRIPGMVAAAIKRDVRVARCDVAVVDRSPKVLRLAVRCIGAQGPFELVVDITRAAALLVSATPELAEAA